MNSKVVIAAVIIGAVAIVAAALIILNNSGSHIDDPYEDIKYTFDTYDTTIDENVTLPVYYEDSYFDKKSTEENPALMSFALCLQMSSGLKAEDTKDKPVSVLKLLKDIGCDNVYANDAYYEESTLISLDVAVGSKQYKDTDTTIIFLVPNGTHYSTQFASNLMVGEYGYHQGFSLAADEAFYTLKLFIQKYNITGDVKLLITGYSRTAAASNILTATISDIIESGVVKQDIGDIDITIDSVYGFCFETPYCGYFEPDSDDVSPTDPRYDNIWYTVNPADLVTYVPPESYGFVRYGNMVTLPSENEQMRETMVKIVSKFYSRETKEKMDLPEFAILFDDTATPKKMVQKLIDLFFEAVGDREYYYNNIQFYVVTALYSMMCHSGMINDMIDEFGGYKNMVVMIYASCGTPEFDEKIGPYVSAATEKYGCPEDTDDIVRALDEVGQAVKRLVSDPQELLKNHAVWTLVLPKNYNYPITSHYPSMTFGYVVQNDYHYDWYYKN